MRNVVHSSRSLWRVQGFPLFSLRVVHPPEAIAMATMEEDPPDEYEEEGEENAGAHIETLKKVC